MCPVIVIPAPYHQPAHYEQLADTLADRGPVHIPDMALLALAEKTARAQALVDACEAPPAVIAHSFAGAVAGGLSGVRAIVFLDAFVMTEDETALSLLGTVDERESAEFLGALRTSEDGSVASIDPEAGAELFFNGCRPEAARQGAALLTSELTENFAVNPRGATWRQCTNLFIRLTDDRAWAPSLVPEMMRRADSVVCVDGGHSSFFCNPVPVSRAVRAFLAEMD